MFNQKYSEGWVKENVEIKGFFSSQLCHSLHYSNPICGTLGTNELAQGLLNIPSCCEIMVSGSGSSKALGNKTTQALVAACNLAGKALTSATKEVDL